jgi:hypothetical protein
MNLLPASSRSTTTTNFKRHSRAKKGNAMKMITRICLLLATLAASNLVATPTASEITDWNRSLLRLAQLEDTNPSDGNSATSADPTWTPLLPTTPYPEYPSAHSCISGAAGAVLSNLVGERTRFSVTSDSLLGVKRSFRTFSAALEEVKNARIFAGIHFRSACDDGQKIGIEVANHVLQNSLQPINQNPGQ